MNLLEVPRVFPGECTGVKNQMCLDGYFCDNTIDCCFGIYIDGRNKTNEVTIVKNKNETFFVRRLRHNYVQQPDNINFV